MFNTHQCDHDVFDDVERAAAAIIDLQSESDAQ